MWIAVAPFPLDRFERGTLGQAVSRRQPVSFSRLGYCWESLVGAGGVFVCSGVCCWWRSGRAGSSFSSVLEIPQILVLWTTPGCPVRYHSWFLKTGVVSNSREKNASKCGIRSISIQTSRNIMIKPLFRALQCEARTLGLALRVCRAIEGEYSGRVCFTVCSCMEHCNHWDPLWAKLYQVPRHWKKLGVVI